MSGAWAVLLAGGRGTRFWPRSRRDLPKQCLALEGERTLLQATLDRIAPLVPPDRVLVSTGRDMEAAVRAQLPEVPAAHFLVEPRGRNTAPPLAWANEEVARRGGDALIALPTDHRIGDAEAFVAVVRDALLAARETGALVLLGQAPTRPEPGFGYVVPGEEAGTFGGRAFLEVGRFVEKPDRVGARALLHGGALWNGGMFVWSPAAFREALERHLPRTAAAVREADVPAAWDRTDAISVDHGVLERHDRLLVTRCDFGWSDLGSWPAMREVFPEGPLGHARVREGVAIDGGGHVVDAPDHLVATLGVKDLVIVEAGGVLLVCARSEAGRVPEILEALRERGLEGYT